MTRGHLFVVHGDLTALACDDICVPTDRGFDLRPQWRPLVPDPPAAGESWNGRRVRRVGDRGGRRVWLTDTGSTSGQDVEWLLEGVREFLAAVRRAVAGGGPPRHGRARHLVGLPVVGVGTGGYQRRRGEVVGALLEMLLDELDDAPESGNPGVGDPESADPGYDIALVCASRSDYAAVQHLRRRSARGRWDLDDALRAEADRLGEAAVTGALVPFLGAGLGLGAGLPDWAGLLAAMAAGTGLAEAGNAGSMLGGLPPQDAALLLEQELGEQEFGTRLRALLDAGEYSLAHGLLATLRCTEAVTTNYDGLFETATAATLREGEQLRVLPWERAEVPHRWLLKLHGDVNRPGSIVLSRRAYLRYDDDRRPLAGMVQSLLLSRHVLFVGFSLADDHVIRLAQQVRDLLEDSGQDSAVGTALALHADPLRARLWEPALRYLAMPDPGGPEAARRLEIFLDRLAFVAAVDASFLLDPRYAALTAESGEAQLAERLAALAPLVAGRLPAPFPAGTAPLDGADPIRARVAELLHDLGMRESPGAAGV